MSIRIPISQPSITELEKKYVMEALASGWVSSAGPYVEQFERAFADLIDVKHAIAVSTGTAALHISLAAMGIGPGDEVIVPDLTFVATANAVLMCGAEPVFCDVNPRTWCMDPRTFERAWSPRTRAIIPVHLYGHPADMTSIVEMCDEWDVWLLEDCAEAHSAEWRCKCVGTFGDCGAFSFYGNKIMTTGEGGMVTTNNSDLARTIISKRGHSASGPVPYYHIAMGYNYRLTNLQAALGLAQVMRMPEMFEKRERVLGWYRERLHRLGITTNPTTEVAKTAPWMTCAVFRDDHDRAAACDKLKECGVDTRPFFFPLHRMPHLLKYRRVDANGSARTCPISNDLCRRGINLPMGPDMTEDQVDMICDVIRTAIT